jgi:hypothetical protein
MLMVPDIAAQHCGLGKRAGSEEFLLEKLADDRPSHDLLWLMLEGDFSRTEQARLLRLSPAQLATLHEKLRKRMVAMLVEFGVEFENSRPTVSSMKRVIPLFGYGLQAHKARRALLFYY